MTLPTDAKARKALPIMTGVLDYFPDALSAVADLKADSDLSCTASETLDILVERLMTRGHENSSVIAFLCALELLQSEITGTFRDLEGTSVAQLLLEAPEAFAAIAAVSKAGNDQHNPGQPLHHARGKSTDHADTAIRHLMERGTLDTDGHRHMAKCAWRCGALAQEELEVTHGLPMARGAKLPPESVLGLRLT